MLCTAGFMDDVMIAHQSRLLDVAAQLKRSRSAHSALGLATKYESQASGRTEPLFGRLE